MRDEQSHSIDSITGKKMVDTGSDESGKAITVLVVDDNLAARNIAKMVLQSDGYDVVLAENGREALECAKRIHPDVILLDYKMPGMDGLEVCRRLRQESCFDDIPVVFLTSMDTAANKAAGFAAGCTDYIAKPIKSAEFLPRIRTHVQETHSYHHQL